MKKKLIVAVVALALVLSFAVGGTLAWLTDVTGPVTNTFTAGDVDIDLWEHTLSDDGKTLKTGDNDITREGNSNYKMVPGNVLEKDPTVTVKAESEACWLFINVEETNSAGTYLEYTVDTTVWTKLEDVDGVYYKQITSKTTADRNYNVLNDKKVTVKSNLTKDQLSAVDKDVAPTLKFTAYAIQSSNLKDSAGTAVNDAAAAWKLING